MTVLAVALHVRAHQMIRTFSKPFLLAAVLLFASQRSSGAPPPPNAELWVMCYRFATTVEEIVRQRNGGKSQEEIRSSILSQSPPKGQSAQTVLDRAIEEVFRDKPKNATEYAGAQAGACAKNLQLTADAEQVASCWSYQDHVLGWLRARAKGATEEEVYQRYVNSAGATEQQLRWWKGRIHQAFTATEDEGAFFMREFIRCSRVQ